MSQMLSLKKTLEANNMLNKPNQSKTNFRTASKEADTRLNLIVIEY